MLDLMSQLAYMYKERYSSVIPNSSQQHLTIGIFGATNTLTPFVVCDNIVLMITHVLAFVEDLNNLPAFTVVYFLDAQLAPIDFVDT
jgi:hypothetical protein